MSNGFKSFSGFLSRHSGRSAHGGSRDDIIDGDDQDNKINGHRGDDTLRGFGGNDRLNGGSGNDRLDGGSGNDLVRGGSGADEGVYVLAENTGATDRYDGGSGNDTLTLVMTRAEWFSAAVQSDIARYLEFLASGAGDHRGRHHDDRHDHDGGDDDGPHGFQFTAFGLSASNFENLNVTVDGVVIDPADAPATAVADVFGDGAEPIDENAVFSGNVLGNDSVPDLLRSVTLISGVAAGTRTFEAGANGAEIGATGLPVGQFSFDPGTDFDYLAEGDTATVSFTYEITDADGDTSQASVTIILSGSNDGPVVTSRKSVV